MMNYVDSPVHVTYSRLQSNLVGKNVYMFCICVLISDATAVAVFFLMEVVYSLGGRWIYMYNPETPCSIPPHCH